MGEVIDPRIAASKVARVVADATVSSQPRAAKSRKERGVAVKGAKQRGSGGHHVGGSTGKGVYGVQLRSQTRGLCCCQC